MLASGGLILLLIVGIWWPWLRRRQQISWRWPSAFSVIVLGLMLLGYGRLGSYSALQQETKRQLANEKQDNALEQQQDDDPQLTRLQQRIRQAPDKSDLWLTLSQQYLYRSQFPEALIALQQAERLEGSSAALDAAKATIYYYQSNQQITSDVSYWLQQALARDPLQYTALMLQASDDFSHARYPQAIVIWERLLSSDNPEIDRVAVIKALTVAQLMQQNNEPAKSAITPP